MSGTQGQAAELAAQEKAERAEWDRLSRIYFDYMNARHPDHFHCFCGSLEDLREAVARIAVERQRQPRDEQRQHSRRDGGRGERPASKDTLEARSGRPVNEEQYDAYLRSFTARSARARVPQDRHAGRPDDLAGDRTKPATNSPKRARQRGDSFRGGGQQPIGPRPDPTGGRTRG